jgi:hypothetical protein
MTDKKSIIFLQTVELFNQYALKSVQDEDFDNSVHDFDEFIEDDMVTFFTDKCEEQDIDFREADLLLLEQTLKNVFQTSQQLS